MKRVPDSVRSPAGLEWMVFKNLPRLTGLFAAGLLVLRTLLGLFIRFAGDVNQEKDLLVLDFAMIGAGVTLALLVIFVAFVCGIVLVAKGPQYTADSYEVNDADRPS